MSQAGSTIETWVRASLGRSSSAIVPVVALFFAGLLINTAIPTFIVHAEETTKPAEIQMAQVRPNAKYTASRPFTEKDAAAFKLSKNTEQKVDETLKEYPLIYTYNEARPQDPYEYILRRNKGKIVFGWVEMSTGNLDKPENKEINEKRGELLAAVRGELDKSQFATDEVYEAAFETLWRNRVAKQWDASSSRVLAEQQAALHPRQKGEWPAYEEGRPVVWIKCNDDFYQCTMDEEGGIYHVKERMPRHKITYQLKCDLLREFKAEFKAKQILVLDKYPDLIYLQLGKDNIFRDVTYDQGMIDKRQEATRRQNNFASVSGLDVQMGKHPRAEHVALP